MSKSNQAKAREFAQKSNLPVYDFVLHTRVKGFQHIFKTLREEKAITAVWDLTMVRRESKRLDHACVDRAMWILRKTRFRTRSR